MWKPRAYLWLFTHKNIATIYESVSETQIARFVRCVLCVFVWHLCWHILRALSGVETGGQELADHLPCYALLRLFFWICTVLKSCILPTASESLPSKTGPLIPRLICPGSQRALNCPWILPGNTQSIYWNTFCRKLLLVTLRQDT